MGTNNSMSKVFNTLVILVTLAMVFSLTGNVTAAGAQPFTGTWRAIDNFDQSIIYLKITGSPRGNLNISWTESYFSFCEGQPGLATGRGTINPDDPIVLEADMSLVCFLSGNTIEWHQVWRYKPAYDVLSSLGDYEVETIWTRPGTHLVPRLDLRVNYGHDWVESFYEAGHTVWVTVTEVDGETVKATAELVTEIKEYLGWETGFQSTSGTWFDAEGNPMENPPDIQPYDWVYAQVDNGQTAKVQIGEINGRIDFEADAVDGTILAPFGSDDELVVECHSWGAPLPEEILVYDSVVPDGDDEYSCSWDGVWNIQPGEDVGVSYFGLDNHWVANALFSNSRFVASVAGNFLWVSEFTPEADVTVSVYNNQEDMNLVFDPITQTTDESGFYNFIFDEYSQVLEAGNYVEVSDSDALKGTVLEYVSVDIFDTELDLMAGTAPAGREVYATAGFAEAETQDTLMQIADEFGNWDADFSEIKKITFEMQPWSFAQIYDDDGDVNEGDPPPLEIWVTSYSYDEPITWSEGEHFYRFYNHGESIANLYSFVASTEAPVYDGYVLLLPHPHQMCSV